MSSFPGIVRVVALHPATRVVPDPFPATLAVPDLLPDPSECCLLLLHNDFITTAIGINTFCHTGQNQYHVDRCQTGVNRVIALEIDRVHVIGPTIDHARSLDHAAGTKLNALICLSRLTYLSRI